MKKTKKNIATMAIIGGLVVTGCFGNVSADIASNSSIGEVRILTGRKTAKATTTISTAAKPANGFSAYAKITTWITNGVERSEFKQAYASSVAVSRTASGSNKFKSARGTHIEYQGGNPLITETTHVAFD